MVRIEQVFPRCARCGKLINLHAPRIVIADGGRRQLMLCSEICRDEYVELHGLNDRGEWRQSETGTETTSR